LAGASFLRQNLRSIQLFPLSERLLTDNGKSERRSAPMTRAFSCIALISLLSMSAFSQSSETPTTFEIADIHASPRSTTTAMRESTRLRLTEVHNSTMLDLLRTV